MSIAHVNSFQQQLCIRTEAKFFAHVETDSLFTAALASSFSVFKLPKHIACPPHTKIEKIF